MGNVVQNVTTTTTADEVQTRNGQDNQRVYDPTNQRILIKILEQLEKMNEHLAIITEHE